jgi:hypothetical protein
MVEQSWKARFVSALSSKFRAWGLSEDAAIEDARAHADDLYPRSMTEPPERHAELTFGSLAQDRPSTRPDF